MRLTPTATRLSRRGTVYVAVLGLAMLALVLGLGGMMAARVEARRAATGSDAGAARAHAVSALALGRRWIEDDPGWRWNKAGSAWLALSPFEDGLISLTVTNPSGALSRSSLDPVVMVATGQRGSARQKLRVTLAPRPEPMACLDGVMWCAGSKFHVTHRFSAPGLLVATNGNFSASGTVDADVEAAGTISGSTYGGTKKAGAAVREMPVFARVLAEYALVGSAGNLATLPLSGGNRVIEKRLIAPNHPLPGVTANPSGVYVLDCKGAGVEMKHLRLVGTLVLHNCAGLTIKEPVCWEPAVANYPCLIVDGPVVIDTDGKAVEETSPDVNLNPSNTRFPYPHGTTNSIVSDTYPAAISGLVYTGGDFTLKRKNWTLGHVVANGQILSDEDVTIAPYEPYAATPPPGIADVKMVPSSWELAID